MKYLPLILAGLWRKPVRTIFTFLSVTVAFVLFGILSAIDAGFARALDVSRQDRLFVDSRFGTPMPIAYARQIQGVPGIVTIASRSGVSGYWRDPRNQVGAIMTDENFLKVRPELTATPEMIARLRATRAGALVGTYFAGKYGWKVGDRIPLISPTAKQDGSRTWTFDIVGIIDDVNFPGDAGYFIGNYEYLDEARVTEKGTVGRFLLLIDDPAHATRIGRAIDALFASSAAPTRTGSERAQTQMNMQSLGDIGFLTHAVITAVIFMILFLSGNTMMQSVRERTGEFAVLKTLGYSDNGVLCLVLAESVILCALAGLAGLALAQGVVPVIQAMMPDVKSLLLISWRSALPGIAIALVIALASGLFPALRARKLNIVDALSRT